MSSTTAGGTLRRQLPLLAWAGTLALGIVLLISLGSGQLATPGLTEVDAWSGWFAEREPVVAAAALLRLVVLGVAWYLVGVTTVSLVAHLAEAAALIRIADALSLPVVRTVVQQAVGATMATAVVASSMGGATAATARAAAADAPAPAATVSMQVLDDAPQATAAMARLGDEAPEASSATVAMERLDDDPAATVAMTRLDPSEPDSATARMVALGDEVATMERLPSEPPVVRAVADAAPLDGVAGEVAYEVVSGDHLWSVAESHLADAWGRAPSDDEVTPYWEAVVEANRGVLDNPDDPDLIHPGQVLHLPTPPSPGA